MHVKATKKKVEDDNYSEEKNLFFTNKKSESDKERKPLWQLK